MDDPNVFFGWTMISQPGGIRAPGDNYSLVGKEAADLAKQLTKDWHPRFKPLFEQMVESEAAFWKVSLRFSLCQIICRADILGIDHVLESERRTAVGEQSSSHGDWRCGAQHDSCRYVFLFTILHLLSGACTDVLCTGGIGWNTASRDSELLGRLLAEAGGYADELTKKYEDEMRVYGGAAVAQSYGFATKSFAAEITDSTPTV